MRVVVIGGGPAGMMSAIFAARAGADVILLERNEKLGKKLYITGKGRCNITNTADAETMRRSIVRGEAFARSALSRFGSGNLIEWLEGLGLNTVEERGGRVFPASNKASDVTKALVLAITECGVNVRLNARVIEIKNANGAEKPAFTVKYQTGSSEANLSCDAVVVATGGLSYPATGSTGDGYRFAQTFGHSINGTLPALVSLESRAEWIGRLQGLSLKNVELSAKFEGKLVYRELGEMLFTHYGISGPLALSLSSKLPGADDLSAVEVSIDMKPALTAEQLNARLLREIGDNSRRQLHTLLCTLMPERLAREFPALCQVPENTGMITREQRSRIISSLKRLIVPIDKRRGFDEAIITRGGIDTREINPRTMESKRMKGLFFAGEVIDIDALTGGFNLQLAFSTGVAAGQAACCCTADAID
ncbi:FAD-dependent oxidoreductase [Clostridia bacterium]|nr:FAD-dependent oxidoreductase [Clostridia bacterium]